MLQTLRYWRSQCSEQQLLDFEHQLEPLLGSKASASKTFQQRYQGLYHLAVMNKGLMSLALHTGMVDKTSLWGKENDYGDLLVAHLANHQGYMHQSKLEQRFQATAALLVKRGIIFEYQGLYCLPAELVVEKRQLSDDNQLLSLISNSSIALARSCIPETAKESMLQPEALRNECMAWLAIEGLRALQSYHVKKIKSQHWPILLHLYQHNIDDFETIKHFYPDISEFIVEAYSFNTPAYISVRRSLEQHFPEDLQELYKLGLIGIRLSHGNMDKASICLTQEARHRLKPDVLKMQKQIAQGLKKTWKKEPCDIQVPSSWYWEQKIWQLWVAIKFFPVVLTKQKKLRKSDVKKLHSLLTGIDANVVEFIVYSMLAGGMLEYREGVRLHSIVIDWKAWGEQQRDNILGTLKGWTAWSSNEDKQALALLAQLPTDCWLDLCAVEAWIDSQTSGGLVEAAWHQLFTDHQTYALHHLNLELKRIYFLPQWQAILHNKPVKFTAPGWYGADKKAKLSGFISASGEIQLPPDCKHKVLAELAEFCTLTSIEQMITLQIDENALKRMSVDKVALKAVRKVLESIQAELPQAVRYLFDKHENQQAVGTVAATSLVIYVNNLKDITYLQRAGFDLSQPFEKYPEMVLLDANADPHAFMQACIEQGIALDSLIKPVEWLTGLANIKAWINRHAGDSGLWLELTYQKTRASKAKSVYAYMTDIYYIYMDVRCVSQKKLGKVLLSREVSLEAKHISRLRELDAEEIKAESLDKLL